MSKISNLASAAASIVSNELPADMAEVIARFDQAAEEITVNFVGELETEPAPAALYHYTNRKGLEGILSSGTLWVGDIFKMNDTSELKHGISQADEILRKMADVGPPESNLFSGQFSTLLSQSGVESVAHCFTCSLCKAGDDPNMWRDYAENERGFALEFDGPLLEEIYTKHPDGLPVVNNSTFPVAYDDAKLRGMLGKIIDAAFPLISAPYGRGLSSEKNRIYIRELWLTVAVHTLRCGLFFKKEKYSIEQEYRLLQVFRGDQAVPSVKLKPCSNFRYREFDWKSRDLAALRRITVGPTAEEGTENSVRLLLSACGFSGVAVDRSSIPYRG